MKKLWHDIQDGQNMIRAGAVVWVILSFLLLTPCWKLYVWALDLGPGGIGSKALGDTPAAHSVADLESLERFTILSQHRQDSQIENVWLDDENYFILTLDSGERVAAKYNYEAAEIASWKSEGVYLYRYPIGVWKPLELSDRARAQAEQISPALASTGFYADMEGNHLTSMSEQAFKGWFEGICLVIAFFVTIVDGVRRVDKRERQEQAARESSLPRNDMERWLVGTYAIWGQFYAQAASAEGKMAWDDAVENGPLHFGGRPMDDASRKLTRETLLDSWDIRNRDELLETAAYMSTGPGFHKCRTQADRAWQLCRSIQLLGMGYIAGWYGREQMILCSREVGRIIQRTFTSWEELGESFLEGYAQWQLRSYPQQASANIHVRREIYENLWKRPDSPYRLDWNLPLEAGEQREERRREAERELGIR